jgi:hypothetical protein
LVVSAGSLNTYFEIFALGLSKYVIYLLTSVQSGNGQESQDQEAGGQDHETIVVRLA